MDNFLLKFLSWIAAALLAGLVFMVGFDGFESSATTQSPCSETLTVQVGDIDSRYNITKPEVEELIREVAGVWSNAAGSNAIMYDENGEISLNLIYADEQKLSDKERQYRDRLEQEEVSITVGEREYQQMKNQYDEEVQQYQGRSNNLQASIDQLNQWVDQKNEQGGFNEEDLERFENRKQQIDQVRVQLANTETRLARKADELNNRVDFLNERVERKNQLVDEYNRTFSGEREFTQGQYQWTANTKVIDIFSFIDREELKLVIAHEVGHALGIGHVQNPKSVMHRLMGEQIRPGIKLTSEDIEALQNVCNN